MLTVHPRLVLLWVGIGAALLLPALRFDPVKPSAKVLRAWVWGLLLMTGWNMLPLPPVGVNPLSALLAGSLGLPGVGLMCMLRLMP